MGKRLFVGNLSYSTEEADLRTAFEADDRVVVAVAANRSGVRFRGMPQAIAELFIQ